MCGKQRVALEHHADVALVRAAARVMSRAIEHDLPGVGSTKPATMRKVVVLPQPDGPSSATNSPPPTDSVASSHGERRRRRSLPSPTSSQARPSSCVPDAEEAHVERHADHDPGSDQQVEIAEITGVLLYWTKV